LGRPRHPGNVPYGAAVEIGMAVLSQIGTQMGIKFLCPNGHKLHVKSFLGGKRAICPKCGARVIVPDGTQRPGGVADGSAADDSAVELTGVEGEGASSQSTASDPLAESPTAVWYVRPASGGQFGPASGDMMRAWMSEGRVGASSLVWRAGWSDWRSAAATFPQLGGQLPSPTPQAVAVPVVDPDAEGLGAPLPVDLLTGPLAAPTDLGADVPPLPELLRKRRRNNDNYLMASAILLAIIVILVIILLLVIGRQEASDESPTQEAPAAHELTVTSERIESRLNVLDGPFVAS
jgi:hypothetical protein